MRKKNIPALTILCFSVPSNEVIENLSSSDSSQAAMKTL
jgi:hypothetical protein